MRTPAWNFTHRCVCISATPLPLPAGPPEAPPWPAPSPPSWPLVALQSTARLRLGHSRFFHQLSAATFPSFPYSTTSPPLSLFYSFSISPFFSFNSFSIVVVQHHPSSILGSSLPLDSASFQAFCAPLSSYLLVRLWLDASSFLYSHLSPAQGMIRHQIDSTPSLNRLQTRCERAERQRPSAPSIPY